jgi:predicted RNase H-like HicB family nuclease
MEATEFFGKARELAEGHDLWSVYTTVTQIHYPDERDAGATGDHAEWLIMVGDTEGDAGNVAHEHGKSPEETLAKAEQAIALYLVERPKRIAQQVARLRDNPTDHQRPTRSTPPCRCCKPQRQTSAERAKLPSRSPPPSSDP